MRPSFLFLGGGVRCLLFKGPFVGEVSSSLFILGILVYIIFTVLFQNQFTAAPVYLCGGVGVSGSYIRSIALEN